MASKVAFILELLQLVLVVPLCGLLSAQDRKQIRADYELTAKLMSASSFASFASLIS